MVNGAATAEGNSPVTMPAAGKQQTKSTQNTGPKAMDTSKKQTSNPSDGNQR